MTSEQFVKSKYPRARVEKYMRGRVKGFQTTYYLVWSAFPSHGGVRLAEGNTKYNAWKNAKENITAQE